MIARKHCFPLALPLAIALLMLGCTESTGGPATASPISSSPPEASAPAADAPAAAAQIGADALTGFLQAAYTDAASLDQPWWNADHTTKLQVCAQQTMAIDGQPHALLAVCGQLEDFGHVSSGPNHFYLLAAGPRGPEVIARSRDLKFGSMGGSGDVRVLRLGQDLYGFAVESGFTGQGYSMGTRVVLLPDGDGFIEAASMRSGLDNSGHMQACLETGRCQPDDAVDVEFALRVDDSEPMATAYPLVVSASGQACGEPATQNWRLTLDRATLSYNVPAELQRDSTCG